MTRKPCAGEPHARFGVAITDEVRIRELGEPGDLGWVVMVHGETYASEFGWDASFELLVARIVSDYASERDPQREAAWIAELDGRRAGCVFVVAARTEQDDRSSDGAGQVAQLRILLVNSEARGHGLGRRLVRTAVDFARSAGYAKLRLWTNHPLIAARHIYLQQGFALIAEEAHQSFGVELRGQTYELKLQEPDDRDDGSRSHRGATIGVGGATLGPRRRKATQGD
jgi:GNAT superfamily N-acetyltransferase